MPRLVNFYALLGAVFNYHRHDTGPYHYSAIMEQIVLEIYPLTKTQTQADRDLRLGLGMDDFDGTIQLLKENGVRFSLEPMQTEHGFMAVVIDPDGRKIELYK